MAHYKRVASESGKGHDDVVLAALLTTREHETDRSDSSNADSDDDVALASFILPNETGKLLDWYYIKKQNQKKVFFEDFKKL